MTSEEQKIIDIKVRYEDAIYGIIRFQEKMAELKTTQKELNEQLKKGEISWNEYALQTEAARSATNQYKENVRVLRKEIQNNLRTEQEQEGSLKQLRAQLSNATKAYDELSRAERQGAKGNELRQHIQKITQELKNAEQETERYYRNVGNYYNSMLDALSDVQGAHFMRIGGQMEEAIGMTIELGQAAEGAGTKIKAFGKTLMGLATNPVFLTIAGIVGAGMTFKFWYDYNKGLAEATRLTREFTGLTGTELQSVRNEIAATADALGEDFKSTLSTVDYLMAQFGLSAQEALKVVQEGLAAGANLSGDMLSKMQQYAPVFKDMGLSAEEMTAVLSQTRSGIFTDKGLEAITQAGKRLREMSETTKKSLEAVGIDVEKLMQDMSSGNITAFQAVQQVAGKLNEVGINSQEAGNVMKDVFGKQAVKAGGELIKSIETMSIDIEEAKKQTGEWGETQQKLIEADKKLNDVMSALFDSTDNGFESWIDNGKVIVKETLTGMLNGVVKLINHSIDLYNKSMIVRAGVAAIGLAFKGTWNTIKLVFNLIVDGFKGIGRTMRGFIDILEGIITFDLKKAKDGLVSIFTGIGKTWREQWNDFAKYGKDNAQAYVDGFRATINGNMSKLEIPTGSGTNATGGINTAGGTTGGNRGNTPSGGNKSGKNGMTAAVNAEKIAAEERKRTEMKLQSDILAIQMQYKERMLQVKKMYLAGLYESDEQYQQELEELEKEEIARLLDVYVEAGAIGEQKALEMQQKLLDLQIQFKEQLKQEAAKMAETWRKEFDAQETERERQLIDQGILEEQDNEARMERYKAFLEEKRLAFEGNAAAIAEIDKKSKEAEEDREKESYEKKKKLLEKNQETATQIANQITSGFSSAFAAMFAEQEVSFKAFMKSILLTTLDAIEKALLAYEAKILAEEIASKSWYGIASAAALSALIAAAFEAAKAGVNSFAVGGLVRGAGTGTSDSVPARLSNGESVMTARATSMFSPILSAFNQLGGGVPIVVNGGGSQMGEDMLAAAVARGFMMCPRPVVSVKEINEVMNRVKVIENRGSL